MGLIQKITNNEAGVHSLLRKDCWQVQKINFTEKYTIENTTILYSNSGIAITLLGGHAMLVVENSIEEDTPVKIELMNYGSSYYIPENIAYTLVMNEGSTFFTVTSPNSQPLTVTKRKLTEKELDLIRTNYF